MCSRGFAELQEASEPVTLLRKIRFPFAKLILEPGHERMAVLLQFCHYLLQQDKGCLFSTPFGGEAHLRVAFRRALGQFDDLPFLEMAQEFAKCPEAEVGLAESGVLA